MLYLEAHHSSAHGASPTLGMEGLTLGFYQDAAVLLATKSHAQTKLAKDDLPWLGLLCTSVLLQ
jgi:hypothetical protein